MRKTTFQFIIALALLFSAIGQVQAQVTYCNDFGQNTSDNTRGWAAANFTVFATTTSIDVKVGGNAIIADGELYNGVANTANVVDVYQDNDATIVLDKGSASFNWIHFTAYADWNVDGVFDPATEKLFFDSNNTNANRTYTIKVPATAALGQTTVRIIMGWFTQDTDAALENYFSPCSLTQTKNARAFDFLINVVSSSQSAILALKAKIIEAKAFTAAQYPIGTISGMYSQVKWDALQSTITNATTFVETGDINNQEQIAAQLASLKAAIRELDASMILPFRVSDEATSYWYQIRDKRATNSYWAVGEYIKDPVNVPQGLIMSQTDDNTLDAQLFKIVKSENGYYIFNKAADLPLSRSVLGGMLQINVDSIPEEVYIRSGADMAHYILYVKTNTGAEQQLNSMAGNNPAKIGFYNGGATEPGNNWEFVEKVEVGQTDFNALKTVVVKAIAMKAVDYPASQFSAEKWNAFVAARTAAIDLVAKDGTTPQVEQAAVDAMVATLQTSIDELTASYITFVASTDTESHYYFVKDKRSPASYLYIGTTVVAEGDTLHNRLLYKKVVPTADSTAYMFKVVAVAGEEGVYQLYSKSNPEAPLSVCRVIENLVHVNADSVAAGEDTKWTFGITPANDVMYRTITSQTSAQQINSFSGAASGFIGFWSPDADDAGNDWSFVPVPVVNAVKNVVVSDLGVSVRGRRIVCADSSAKLSVYGVLGQKINANADLARGIYLVKVVGKQGTAKVFVK